jgi:hypothetical protein
MHAHPDAIAAVRERVAAIVDAEGAITLARLRDELGTSRRLTGGWATFRTVCMRDAAHPGAGAASAAAQAHELARHPARAAVGAARDDHDLEAA